MGTYHIAIIYCLLTLFNAVDSFNIDSTANRLDYTIPEKNSAFGYTVGLFKTSSGYKLIVGAPEYKNKTGALFECGTRVPNVQCIKINITDDPSLPKNIGIIGGAEQLGRSIRTTKTHIQVCGPMWNDKTSTIPSGAVPLYGRCLIFNTNLDVEFVNSPCHQLIIENVTKDRHGYCTAGFENELFEIDNGDNYAIIGSIGSWRYRGSFVAINNDTRISNFTNLYEQPKVNIAEGSNITFTDVHSLLGYATTKGKFEGPSTMGIAAGAPRENIYGEVIVYSLTKTNGEHVVLNHIASIKNPEKATGSFFGGAIASIDYNGDGFDDLVIGSPLYSSKSGNIHGQDEGKVYIYRNTQQGKTFVKEDIELFGLNQRMSRFGYSIVNIGDINGDGFDDIAIGAPFGGTNNKGSVFIYNVRKKIIQEDFTQILQSPGADGFGVSIAAEKIDTRIYPALAIGASVGSQVYLFQAKTVITLKDFLWVNSTRVPTESFRSNCKGPDGKMYHCVLFNTTLKDASTNPPAQFDIQITIQVDTGNTQNFGKRALMLDAQSNSLVQSSQQKLRFNRGGSVAIDRTIFFSTEKTTDFGTPIIITSSYSAFETPLNCENSLCAVLDKFGDINSEIEVKYLRKCGEDDICDIDLAIRSSKIIVSGKQNKHVLLGSLYEEVIVQAEVTNYNESAYLAHMSIKYNSDFELVQIQLNDRNIDLTVTNNDADGLKPSNNKTTEFKFLLANPILQFDVMKVDARFALRQGLVLPSTKKYDFDLQVTSTGRDYNPSNNNVTESVTGGIESCLRVQLDGEIKGNIAPPVFYNATKPVATNIVSVGDIGPIVEYNFLIQNGGRKDLELMTIDMELINTIEDNQQITHRILYPYDLVGVTGTVCNQTGINDGSFQVLSKNVSFGTINGTRSRKRRELPSIERISVNKDYIPILKCLNGKCRSYTCKIDKLRPGSLTGFRIAFAIYLSALKKLRSDSLEVEVKVTFGGPQGTFLEQKSGCNKEILVRQPIHIIRPIEQIKPRKVEWWIILVAVVGALIILAIFCAILYRIGFFKRQRPEDQQQLQAREEKYEKNHAFDDD